MDALSAMTSLPHAVLRAQTPANARRLDLHHHFGSPRWNKRVRSQYVVDGIDCLAIRGLLTIIGA